MSLQITSIPVQHEHTLRDIRTLIAESKQHIAMQVNAAMSISIGTLEQASMQTLWAMNALNTGRRLSLLWRKNWNANMVHRSP